MSQTDTEKLAEVIKRNPGATVTVDNDTWYIQNPYPADFDSWDGEEMDEWQSNSMITTSHDYARDQGHGYLVLEALASLAGVTVESV